MTKRGPSLTNNGLGTNWIEYVSLHASRPRHTTDRLCDRPWTVSIGIVTAIRACGLAGGQVAKRMKKISYKGYRFPPEIIQHAIWLYALSFRDVEDLLAARGIIISYETVRRWVNYFGPKIAVDLRKRRPKPHTTWHLDEVYLKIDGRTVYLWRAVDAEGEVLDVWSRAGGTSRRRSN